MNFLKDWYNYFFVNDDDYDYSDCYQYDYDELDCYPYNTVTTTTTTINKPFLSNLRHAMRKS
jgi:hypothetical protein